MGGIYVGKIGNRGQLIARNQACLSRISFKAISKTNKAVKSNDTLWNLVPESGQYFTAWSPHGRPSGA